MLRPQAVCNFGENPASYENIPKYLLLFRRRQQRRLIDSPRLPSTGHAIVRADSRITRAGVSQSGLRSQSLQRCLTSSLLRPYLQRHQRVQRHNPHERFEDHFGLHIRPFSCRAAQ